MFTGSVFDVILFAGGVSNMCLLGVSLTGLFADGVSNKCLLGVSLTGFCL